MINKNNTLRLLPLLSDDIESAVSEVAFLLAHMIEIGREQGKFKEEPLQIQVGTNNLPPTKILVHREKY